MSTLTGTRRMLALTIRRERLHASAWFGLVALLLIIIAAGIIATYPTENVRQALAESVNSSPGELFLIGPVSGTDLGSIGLWRTQGVAAIFISLASIFTVIRNTRATEETGASEMLGSAAIGRAAPLLAALGVAAAGSLLAGLVVGIGFVAIGAAAGGGILVGVQVALFGLLAAALAALTGQIVQTARAATGIGVAVVAAFYLLRGTGDTIGGAAYWLSPFGWIAAVRPFTDVNAMMLLPALALTAALGFGAVWIASRRDLGAGLLPDRPGRIHASAALAGATSLALRVSRGAMIDWAAGALVVGVLIGGVSSTVDSQIALQVGGDSGAGGGLVRVALYLSPMFAAVFGIQTTLRLRGEVFSGRAEAILSRPVSRSRWLLAHMTTGALGSLAVLLAFGLGIGLAQTGTDPGAIVTFTVAAIVRAPATWVFVTLTTLLLATVPRAATATAFIVLGAYLALEFAVEFRVTPPEALYVSPFAIVPQLPDGPTHLGPTLFLILIAAALTVIGSRTVRKQDIH